MKELATYVISGVVSGGIYAMLAAGVVLTYQTSGVFNFAHGAVAFASAFLFMQLDTGLGWPVWAAAVLAVLVLPPLLGLVLDRAIFRRLAGAPEVVRLVVPIALLVVIPSACLLVVDRLNAWFDAGLPRQDQVFQFRGLGPSPKVVWRFTGPLDGVVVNSDQVVVLVVAGLMAVGLWVLIRHTALGLQMRAVVDRRGLAGLRGIDADRTSTVAWVLASVLAGLCGVLLAPVLNNLNAPTFTTVVLVSTAAVVIARFRSIPWAMVGGMVVGVVQNLVVGYADFARSITGFRTSVPFVLLFVLLFFLGPDRTRQAGATAEAVVRPAPPPPPTARRRLVWGAWTAVLLVYVFAFADDYWRSLVARGLAIGLVLLSFTIITGIGGMVSLAQAAFVTLAGFTAGWALDQDLPFLVALALGTVAATVVGAIVSLPARRLGGLPLALSTMALAYAGQYLVFQIEAVSNADSSGWRVRPPEIGPFDFGDRRTMIVGLLVLLAIAVKLVGNLMASASGRAMVALRSTEAGAVTVGIRSARTKMVVFALSAGMAGFGGVLLASTNGRISTMDFPVEMGFFWLASTVVFGVRRPAGAVLAGLAAALSPEVLGWISDGSYLPQVMFGLAAVNLAQNPDGILALVAERSHVRRARRAAGEATADGGAGPEGRTAAVEPADGDGAQPAEDAALVVRGVRAGYGDAEVVHGVDLVVPRGEVVALIGANGAGKSTLCSVVAGTVPATAGRVGIGGADVTDLPPHRRVEAGVFLVPEGRGIFPGLSVEENLALWLTDPADREAAYERFPRLGERRGQAAGSLSGGEQQMLALAPALVRPPLLLVADEPSLGLAPRIVDEVYDALRELRDRGTAVLLVEEKANDVLALADTVAFLQVGRLAWVAPASEVDEDRLVRSYLGLSSGPPAEDEPEAEELAGAEPS